MPRIRTRVSGHSCGCGWSSARFDTGVVPSIKTISYPGSRVMNMKRNSGILSRNFERDYLGLPRVTSLKAKSDNYEQWVCKSKPCGRMRHSGSIRDNGFDRADPSVHLVAGEDLTEAHTTICTDGEKVNEQDCLHLVLGRLMPAKSKCILLAPFNKDNAALQLFLTSVFWQQQIYPPDEGTFSEDFCVPRSE